MLKTISPLVPSTTLMKSLAKLTSTYGAPILDAPSGFGRNALALAARGYDVVGVDRDMHRLRSMESSATNFFRSNSGPNACGRLMSVCVDLVTDRLPFAKCSFSAVICIHYPVQTIILDLDTAIQTGGHFYIE